ncbi:MAG: DUF3025 domain-containing protein [Betaproteobacteria bacterium]
MIVASQAWHDAAPALATPYFEGVRPMLEALRGEAWPTLVQLNALAATRQVVNARSLPIRFVPPSSEATSAMRYETNIAESGEVPTRDNWHDLFNALQWIAFPHLKAAINTQHARLLAAGGTAEAVARSVPRDVLTMVDESGVIVASADASLLELIRAFRWRELFVIRRHEVIANMRFVLVGHGLMEKSLAPFVGMTAKAMLLNVDGELPALDRAAADWLMNEGHLADSRQLAPLPLLGIPGWDARNVSAAFYDNTTYFRTGRRRRT